jgi:hypothetical protein
MRSIKTHLLVSGLARFSEYAALCSDSLIRRGGVEPSSIIVSAHAPEPTRALQVLEKMGVDVRYYKRGAVRNAKLVYIDRYFSEPHAPDAFVQLDADCILTQDVDLYAQLESNPHLADMCGYTQTYSSAQDTFRVRENLLHKDFKTHLEDEETGVRRSRFNSMALAGFGVSLRQFHSFLERVDNWVFGGLTLIRRSMIETLEWRGIQLFSHLSSCDETAIMLARCSNPTVWTPISQEKFPHVVDPPEFSLEDAPGILHYAGDWYRYRDAANRAILSHAYQNLRDRVL